MQLFDKLFGAKSQHQQQGMQTRPMTPAAPPAQQPVAAWTPGPPLPQKKEGSMNGASVMKFLASMFGG